MDGYSNTIETLSGDDDLLLREAVKNNLKIGTIISSEAFVYSNPRDNIKDYIQQKSRHISTSFHYLFKHKLILGFWHIINLILLFSPLLMFLSQSFFLLFVMKIIIDEILISIFKKRFGYNFNLFEIIYLQVIYEVFIIINFFAAKFTKIEWK